MRAIFPFNHDWLYLPQPAPADTPDSAFEAVIIPHTNKILPYHNFDDAEYQFVSTYRKRFTLPEARAGRRVLLDFDGAMIAATVTLNEHTFPEHRGGYVPFSLDLTDHLDEDGENLLTVQLDSTERPDIPPFGHTVDYLTFGGIYRDVRLRYMPECAIEDAYFRYQFTDADQVELMVHVTLSSSGTSERHLTVSMDANSTPVHIEGTDGEGSQIVTLTETRTVKRWTPTDPQLYTFTVQLHDGDTVLDTVDIRTGFRQAEFREDGFYLNGERLQLRGLNRHQMFPYFGAAAPDRLQIRDADIVKYELGCNIVRTSHYPQSPAFINRCDEIGLLVFEEIPGWQHIGDADWKGLALRDVRAMIERDRNHPCIILWGVRINESFDDTEFYTATNTLARELDPMRQTGGVRYFMGSEFLEDVFTYNDFSDGVLEPENTPHLITEFNGHMFPTKTFDHEERQVEHAVRHARIQSLAAMMGGVSGAIGWCAFDYNTHKEFGSGDRICYHGVMDIFRLPKFAADFYASQQEPSGRVVMRAATFWRLGDRSAGLLEPLYVFTNCDEVEVFLNDERVGKYQPNAEQFPRLPHPPVTINRLNVQLAQPYGDLRLVGYLNGEVAAEQRIARDGIPVALELTADDTELAADGRDMTRIAFRITDTYGNRLPYAIAPVFFEIEGPGVLIGENPFPLVGGQAALWLRTRQEPGEIVIRATTHRLPAAEVRVTTVV